MAVTQFTKHDKANMAVHYVFGGSTISYIAGLYGTSPRTVGRILKELKVVTRRPSKPDPAKKVMKTLQDYQVSPEQLPAILQKWSDSKKRSAKIPALLLPKEQLSSYA